MSLSTITATIQDPSGQAFANGTWQLIFKPTYGTPGLFTDGGVSFNTLLGGSLDATGSFSQSINRNDTISPAGSHWTLLVTPNASGQAYSVDLNVNSPAFNASSFINAVITNIQVNATPIALAYKDSELVPAPKDGSAYFDTTLNVMKVWDASNGVWLTLTPDSGNPIFNNVLVGGTLGAKTINKVRYVDSVNSQGWAGSDPGAWINAAAADAGTLGIVELAPVAGGTYPAITTALVLPRGLTLKFPPGVFQIVGGTTISNIGVTILGSGRQSTYLEPTSATGNIFTIATGGTNFEIGNLSIIPTVPRTSGATFSINDGQCLFHDLFIQDMFDGFVQNSGSTGNTFKDIIVVSAGGNWHNVFKNAPLASGTIPGTTIDNIIITLTGATVTGDAVVFDSGTDSTKISGLEISKLTGVDSNVGFRIQSTGAAQIPSYMEIVKSYVEVNATSVAVQIDNAQLPVFDEMGIGGGIVGLKQTGGKGLRWTGGFFNSTQQGAAQFTGGSDFVFTENAITDCARAGANTYDAISVAAGITGFNISNNRIGTFLFASSIYHNGITIFTGASDNYVIAGNIITGFGSTSVFDGGTGTSKFVEDLSNGTAPSITPQTFNLLGAGPSTSLGLHDTTPAAPTPFKYFRIVGGVLQLTNSAFNVAILTLDDSGNLTVPGTQNKTGQADIVADSSVINTVETIIVKTPALVANRLIAGTHVRATIVGTCTSSAANASTFTVRMGLNGTTADTAVSTAVLAASAASGTNIPYKVILDFTVRTVGASATGFVSLELQNQGTTGISSTVQQIMLPSMSAFDTTAAGNIISFSYKTAAATTTSIFKQAVIEFVYN